MSQALKDFFNIALKGESKTYDDHNWYTNSGLKGYIKGVSSKRYPLFNKNLSEYTIAEVIGFQANPRNANGQLWATGRYQIIPNTLKGLVKARNLSTSQLYSESNQDMLGYDLLRLRPNLNKYIHSLNSGTQNDLELAALDMSKIWSSIGVPYRLKGAKQMVEKNQSYYSGGGDRASQKTEDIQNALKKLRSEINGKTLTFDSSGDDSKKKLNPLITTIISSILTISIWYLIKTIKK